MQENNIALPPFAKPSVPTGYSKPANADTNREMRKKIKRPSPMATELEARNPMMDCTNVKKTSLSSPDNLEPEIKSDLCVADTTKGVELTLTPENSSGRAHSNSGSLTRTPMASNITPLSMDHPHGTSESAPKHEVHQDNAFSDDESAGSVTGFSDDEDDGFNGCVDDLSDGDDDFEAFLNFQDAESNDSFVDEDDAGASSFSESCTDDGQEAASTVDIESVKAAAAAAARQEAELDQLRLQKELTLMTEKFLRTKVAMLEQKQELEQTRTQVADRAASENEDLKAALHGSRISNACISFTSQSWTWFCAVVIL